MINELTPDQIALQKVVAQEWVDLAHSGFFDITAAKKAVETVYEISGIAPPKEVIIADSSMAAIIISLLLKSEKASVGANVGANVWASVGANVWDSVGANVWDSVGANVRASVGASVWDSVGDSVWDSVGASVWDSVGANVWDSVGASVGDSVWDRCAYFNFSDFGWTSFYSYFRQIGVLKHENFEKWEAALKSNVFEIYPYENICIAVKPPVSTIKNDDGLLHNTSGPAIVFPDGYCQYYINGRNLPAWIWEQKDTITRDMFLSEKNAEIRGGIYAVLGPKKMFDLLGAEEVCRKFANNETYVLYKTKEKIGDQFYQWVGVKCPSTSTDYLLGVPESVTCPIEAVASTWGLRASEYIINQHT